MTWFAWLGLAVFITAVAAVAGLTPKGGRPVAKTGLMTVARVVLVMTIVLVIYLVYRAHAGG